MLCVNAVEVHITVSIYSHAEPANRVIGQIGETSVSDVDLEQCWLQLANNLCAVC
jgi:hypothetical protein